MGGFDDHVAVMEDWMPPSPSLRAYFSSISSNDVAARSIMDEGSGNRSGAPFPGPQERGTSGNADQKDQTQARVGGDEPSNSNAGAEQISSSRGGLMERMAARAGFNAPRLNTESIRPADLSKKPEVGSSYVTISPGISPTTLLESPVFLSNSLVQPSPTTGKFSFGSSGSNLNSTLMIADPDKGRENTFEGINASSFAFKPHAESASFPYFNAANKVNPSGNFAPQSFRSVVVSVHADTLFQHQSIEPPKVQFENNSAMFHRANLPKSHEENNRGCNFLLEQTYNSVGVAEHSPPLEELHEDEDQRSGGDPNIGSSPAEDGYNWRKYGQKHVKGSEYPRSYYKCTHPSCLVKKKVERSQGHITEIIYNGNHNHEKPPPNRRSALGSANALGVIQLDPEQTGSGGNEDFIWSVMQKGNVAGAPDWKPDNLEAASIVPLGQEYSHGATTTTNTLPAQSIGQYEPGDGADGSSSFSNTGHDDDHTTHDSVSLGYDGEVDELESKRRRIETYTPEMTGPVRSIREPRVVVQTTSDVDILDDGYRWRKYGQKVVKGNPNPRSYYKCTSPGCNVRKHVERASHNLGAVITTYEGKHNHDVPAARNSSHMNPGCPNALTSQQAASGHIPRAESSKLRGMTEQFEGPSPASFGLRGRQPQLGRGPGLGYGMNQPGLPSLGLPGLGPNQGKLPVVPVHPYLGHNQPQLVSEMGYMLPKGEPNWSL